MTVLFIANEDRAVFALYADRDQALKNEDANVGSVVQSADQLGSLEINTAQLLVIHNRFAAKETSRFADRQTAVRRTWAAIAANVDDIVPETKTVVAPEAPKAPKAPKAKKEKAVKPERVSPRDKPLFADDIPTPYRKNTQSYDTWVMLVKNPGKSFKELSAMKARENTLADGIRRGFIVFAAPETSLAVNSELDADAEQAAEEQAEVQVEVEAEKVAE